MLEVLSEELPKVIIGIISDIIVNLATAYLIYYVKKFIKKYIEMIYKTHCEEPRYMVPLFITERK